MWESSERHDRRMADASRECGWLPNLSERKARPGKDVNGARRGTRRVKRGIRSSSTSSGSTSLLSDALTTDRALHTARSRQPTSMSR